MAGVLACVRPRVLGDVREPVGRGREVGMSVGIENVFNLSNRDARTSSAERLYTYVQLYRHIQHASRTRSSRHDPAIVAHAADAADNAIVAPGDHAPAAKSTKST